MPDSGEQEQRQENACIGREVAMLTNELWIGCLWEGVKVYTGGSETVSPEYRAFQW